MSRARKRGRRTSLEEAEVHSALSNERRLLVLKLLRREAGERMSVRELSERIAAVETDESPPPRNRRKSVYVTLLQSHLPKLDDFGIVDYDEQSKTVGLDERSDEVWVYLETVPKYGISWSEYYLGTACLGILLVIAAKVGVPLIADAGLVALAVSAFLLVGGGAVYQTIRQESSIWHRLRNGLD